MPPLYQSILFAAPLVCGALALLLGATFRRLRVLRYVLVALTVISGGTAGTLIVYGLLGEPKVEIYQTGFRANLAATADGDAWSPIAWALPRTSGAAIEISGKGGASQKRQLVARQTVRGKGQLIVDYPSSPGRKLDLETVTTPIEGSSDIEWRGQTYRIAWRDGANGEKAGRLVVTHPSGATDIVEKASLRYPKAWQFPDRSKGRKDINRSGLFLTQLGRDRGEKLHLLALDPDLPTGGLVVGGSSFAPESTFTSKSDPNYLRVTRWNTVRKRFQTHVFELTFLRNQVEGKLVDVARFDRLRLPMEFLRREDTVHFLVSDWLYRNPNPSPSELGSGSSGGYMGDFEPAVGDRISKYNTSARPGTQVALTFDDGPVDKITPKVLDTLRRHQIAATFFVKGDNAKRNPELMQRIREEGHEIGNHSWDHSPSWYLKADDQITKSNQVIAESGPLPRFFRPPYGAMGKSRKWLAQQIADKYNMETIFWSIDPQEFRKTANDDEVIRHVVGNIHDGAVVLMHDINTRTMRTLPEIINNLKRQKVEFLTLSEMKAVSEGEVIPTRQESVRLPLTSGLPSYLTLPYLPAEASGSGTRIEIRSDKPALLATTPLKAPDSHSWELPTASGGAAVIHTDVLGPTPLMILLVVIAMLITALAVAKLGNLHGAFLVAVLGLVLTRLVLALSADHVFPDNVNLWNPTPLASSNWLVENTTAIAVLAPILLSGLIVPAIVIGLQDSLGNRLVSKLRLRKWFGFLLGLLVLFITLSLVWLAGSGERIGPVQKSAFYLPIIILATSWIVGVGGARSADSRALTERCWPVFAALFLLLAAIHGMFAVFRQDLGAILVLLPATWLFLCYASSQSSWIWRGMLWLLAGLAVMWSVRFIGNFLQAIHHDDYPFEIIPHVRGIKAVLAAIIVFSTLLVLRALPNQTARRIGLPILGLSLFMAIAVQFIPVNAIARKVVVPKTESRKESLYSQYLRFRSVDRDFLNSEGTQRAMEISEEQKIVDVYAMGGWFGDGFGTLPFDRSRYNFLNDYLISTFVRGQFGLTGVLAIAVWQLALLYFSARLTIPRLSGRSQVTARLGFWEAAGKLTCWVIGCISIYMVISNLGFRYAPLTGKNVFLLGLNSSSDVLETSLLICLISAAAISVQNERKSIQA